MLGQTKFWTNFLTVLQQQRFSIATIVAFVVLISGDALQAQIVTDTAAIYRAREDGFKWVDKKKYPEAIAEYKKGLVFCDATPEGWSGRSLLYSNIAASFQLLFQFDSAIYYARNAVAIKVSILKDTTSLSTAVAFRRLGSVYTDARQPDSAICYLQKSLHIVETQSSNDPTKQSDILMAIANAYLLGKSDYGRALQWFHRGLSLWEQQSPPKTAEILRFTYSIGSVYRVSANYAEARKWQERAWPLAQSLKDTLRMSNVTRELAWIDYGESKLDQAEQRFREVLRLRQIVYGADHQLLADCFGDIGAVLNENNKPGEALVYHEKAIQLGEKNYQPNHPRLAILYGNFSICLGQNMDYEKALIYGEKQLNIYRKNGKNLKEIADGCSFVGEILANMNAFDRAYALQEEALTIHLTRLDRLNREKVLSILAAMAYINNSQDSFQQALHLREKYADLMVEDGSSNAELAYLLSKIGEAGYCVGNAVLADSLFEQAFRLLGFSTLSGPMRTDVDLNTKLQNLIKSKIRGLDVYIALGHPERRQELQKYTDWGLELLNKRYFETSSQSTRQGLIRSNYGYFVSAFQLAADRQEPEQSLQIAEKAKARTLASKWSFHQNSQSGVPAELLEQEVQLQREITNIQEVMHKNIQHEDSLKALLFKLQKDLQDNQESLRIEHSAYYQQRYGLNPPTLQDIRRQLLDDQTLLVEYVVHKDKLGIIAVSNKSQYVEMRQLEVPIEPLVASFLHLISAEESRYAAERLDSLKHMAFHLYQLLLERPMVQLGGRFNRIIIVPDGALGRLPFSALLTQLPDHLYFQNWPWLIQSQALQYAPSAALLIQQQKNTLIRPADLEVFAGFAPVYPESANTLLENRFRHVTPRGDTYDLPFAREEVRQLSALMGGKSWLGAEATEQQFRQQAGRYRILHLAMHGVANEAQPAFSKLFFYATTQADDPDTDGDLSAGDLLNLRFNADLAVLSACQTAAGKTLSGEGVFSLSYGFMAAGVPAVVATQWNTNDKHTLPLMLDFYRQLLRKQPKDLALQRAVKSMMQRSKSAPELAHPYYWAPFMLSGSRTPIR